MGKLVLTRCKGESVLVGGDMLTVQVVERERIKISNTWLYAQERLLLENCMITLCVIEGRRVKLLFEADNSVKIVRAELLKRSAVNVH